MAEQKYWKIYRGTLQHRENGTVVFWSASEEGVKRAMRHACNENKDYEGPGQYSYVYIPPTKRGLVEWLDKNFTLDNG